MNQEIAKLVEESFLSGKDKSFLLKLLGTEGITDNFYTQFKNLLIEEIKKISKQYKIAIKSLNDGFKEIDEWFEEQQKELDKDIEKQLKNAEATNLKEKGNTWDDYDKKITILSKEYKKRLEGLTSKLMISQIK